MAKGKIHQNLDAMRPVTRINVPMKRNRKENTQFKKGKNVKKKGKCRKKRSNQYMDIIA